MVFGWLAENGLGSTGLLLSYLPSATKLEGSEYQQLTDTMFEVR